MQISESKNSFNFLSEKLITTTDKLEKVMESHIDTNNKLDKIMESNTALQNDNKSMREELALIKELPKFGEINIFPHSKHENMTKCSSAILTLLLTEIISRIQNMKI